jgi:predicted TIM-barrel fold metal-dependent hydrolase
MQKLITTDCHVAVPPSVVEELPSAYREYFARVEHRDDGDYMRLPSSTQSMGLSVPSEIKLEGDAGVRMSFGACPEANPSFEPAEMLADLERDGVYGAVLISRLSILGDTMPIDADIAYCEVANDWLAESWAPYLDRVAPGIMLPYRDVAACVKEMERCAAKGMRPALLPDGIGTMPYHRPEWEPFWEAASALKMPITMHVGGTRHVPNPNVTFDRYKGLAYVGWYNQCVGMGETLGWLTFSGVFERHPDLHVIMTEGYAGWLAFAMQFWDHHWNDSRFGKMSAFGDWSATLAAPPSYYLKRQAHATFMWDPLAIEARHHTGTDCLLWANDYPHPEGSFPFSKEWNDKQFAGVPQADIDAIVGGNAATLFNITV